MTDHQQIGLEAVSENDKSLFILRMFWIIDHQGILVFKDSHGLFKGDMMLLTVDRGFRGIPFKTEVKHNYIIMILSDLSSGNGEICFLEAGITNTFP